MQVGDKQPRSFSVNNNVMVRDLRPNATDRWRKGIVTKVLGPLNYEVTVDGHSRQAHVDHLLPGTSNLDDDSPANRLTRNMMRRMMLLQQQTIP